LTENAQPVSDAIDENFSTFVGEKYASYYQRKWQQTLGSLKSFNIATFFLGVFWLIYRKMYLYAAIFLGLIFVDISIEMFYPLPEMIGKSLNWAIAAVFGVMGNYWYKLHATKKVKEITETFPPEQVLAELAKQGGTNMAGALIALVILGTLIGGLAWFVFSGTVEQ
jgi:Protein of unknown function (DUF2628)